MRQEVELFSVEGEVVAVALVLVDRGQREERAGARELGQQQTPVFFFAVRLGVDRSQELVAGDVQQLEGDVAADVLVGGALESADVREVLHEQRVVHLLDERRFGSLVFAVEQVAFEALEVFSLRVSKAAGQRSRKERRVP